MAHLVQYGIEVGEGKGDTDTASALKLMLNNSKVIDPDRVKQSLPGNGVNIDVCKKKQILFLKIGQLEQLGHACAQTCERVAHLY